MATKEATKAGSGAVRQTANWVKHLAGVSTWSLAPHALRPYTPTSYILHPSTRPSPIPSPSPSPLTFGWGNYVAIGALLSRCTQVDVTLVIIEARANRNK